MKLYTSKPAKWFFKRYFGIKYPVFKVEKNAIHYLKNGKCVCRAYQFKLWNIPDLLLARNFILAILSLSVNPFGVFLLTDTTAVNNKDSYIRDYNPTTNYGSAAGMFVAPQPGDNYRSLIKFTLPPGSGTISDIKLFLYKYTGGANSAGWNANLHQITQGGWTEAGVTWNKYDGTNNWATAGGDFSATIVDAVARTTTSSEWHTWGLVGSTATNPIAGLTWGGTVDMIIKPSTSDLEANNYEVYYTKEYVADTSKRPYIEITYTAATFTPQIIIM